MFSPPFQNVPLDLQALSGVAGSISIACWIVVFSPQIIQNFRRGSAEGLSLVFLAIWLAGDVFNIVGAVLQGVLPTMIILAAYYTIADVLLLFQCLHYRRKRAVVDPTHLSPATPLLPPTAHECPPPPTPRWKAVAINIIAVLTVVLAGVIGFLLSPPPSTDSRPPEFSVLGQVFGYLCAGLYLASRVPQILLNYKRKSCEGVSVLFFVFAGVGNVTYVLSIVANTAGGGEGGYGRYLAVNASWILGSVGTLLLDLGIFGQFFWYGEDEDEEDEDEEDEEEEEEEEC